MDLDKLQITLTPELRRQLDAVKARGTLSYSEIGRRALAAYLSAQGEKLSPGEMLDEIERRVRRAVKAELGAFRPLTERNGRALAATTREEPENEPEASVAGAPFRDQIDPETGRPRWVTELCEEHKVPSEARHLVYERYDTDPTPWKVANFCLYGLKSALKATAPASELGEVRDE